MTSTTSNIAEDTSTDDFDSNIDQGTSTGNTFLVILNTTRSLNIYDINSSELYPTSWCTTYTKTITTITPGKLLTTGNFCSLIFDDTERFIDFQMPVIASPSTCSDSANIWIAWLKETSGNGYDPYTFKISIDLTKKQIRVLGHSKKSVSSYFTFEAHFTLPNGMDTYFEFSIYPPDCTSITYSFGLPTMTNYILGTTKNSKTTNWTLSPSGCFASYDAT